MPGKDRLTIEIDLITKASGINEVLAQFEAAARRLTSTSGAIPAATIQQQQSQLQTAASRRLTQLGGAPGLYGPSGQAYPSAGELAAAQARLAQIVAQGRLAARGSALANKFGLGSNQLGLAERLQGKTDAIKASAKQNEILAGDSAGATEYRKVKAQETRARARLSALIQEELAITRELAQAKAREARARAIQRRQLAEELSGPSFVGSEARARLAEQRLQRARAAAVAQGTTRSDINAQADLDLAQRRLRTRTELATQQRRTPSDIREEANLGYVKRLNEARLQEAANAKLSTAAGQKLLATEGRLAAVKQSQAAQIEQARSQALSTDQRYINAQAAAAKAKEEQAARIALAREGIDSTGLSGTALQAEAAVAQRISADRQAAATATALSRANRGAVEAAVERRNAEARLRAAEAQLEREYIKRSIAQGGLQGTFFQRLQARYSATPRAPQEFQQLGQFVGQKVLATAGYGIGASLFYGGISGLSNLIQEASELQQIFVQIDNQLTSLGQGAQTEQVKEQVLGIARATGVASDEVGKVAFQFIGAFGGDTTKALKETQDAMKLVQVTGLELNEVVDSLTAISKTYNVTVEEIGNSTLGLQERFGVLSKEIVTFVGDTAAVGEEAQLSFKDLAAIGAIAQQQSGKSGAVLAEQFNRILPAIADSKNEILSLYQILQQGPNGSQFQAGYQNILDALSRGSTGDVFKQIVADFQDLDEAQRNAIIRQLGGRREAQTLIAILRESDKLMAEFSANEQDAGRDAGKLNDKFEDIQSTLRNTGQRLGEAFKQLGEAILSSGLGEFLADVGNSAAGLLGILNSIISVGSGFNDLLGGFPGDLLKVVLIAGGLYKLFASINGLGFINSIKSFVTLKSAVVATTAASGQQAAAHAAVAAAATAEAGAVNAATAADAAQAQSSTTAAAANGFQARSSGLLVPTSNAGQVAGAAGGRLAGSALGARLFSGAGSGFFGTSFGASSRLANSGLVTGANASAASAGIAAGASPAAIAALVVAGGLVVKSSYDERRAGIEEQAKGLKEQMKEANLATLQRIADENTEFMDRAAIRFFGQELPEDMARAEISVRKSDEGRKVATQLAQDPRLLEIFRDKISEGNVNILEDYLQQGLRGPGRAVQGSPARFAIDQGIAKIEGRGNDVRVELDRSSLTPERIKAIRDKAEAGDAAAAEVISFIDDVLNTQDNLTSLNAYIDELVNNGDTQKAIEEAGGVGAFLANRSQTVRAQVDAGLATQFELEDKLRAEVQALRDQESRGGLSFGEQDLVDLANGEKELKQLAFDRFKRLLGISQKFSELNGGTAAQSFELQLNALRDPDLTGAQRLELLPEALDGLKTRFEEELENIKDPVERAQRALDGYEIPPEIRALLVSEQLVEDQKYQEVGKTAADALGTNLDNLNTQVVDLVATTDLSVKEALLKILDDKIAELQQVLAFAGGSDAINAVNAELNRLKSARDSIANDAAAGEITVQEIERVKGNEKELQRKALEVQRDRVQAYLDLAAANAAGNPEAEAAVEIQRAVAELNDAQADGDPSAILRAQANLVRAQKSAAEAAFSVVLAQAELLRVAADGDPVREASASMQIAYLELQQALRTGDRAGQAQARGQILQAQQQARDASNDIIKSRLEIDKAVVEQDPVAAAQFDIALADFDISTARGEAERNRAIVAKIQAQRALQESLLEVQKSRLEIASAIAERDPVKAAQIALQQADLELANAQGEAERNNATAARIRAQRQLEDAIAAIAASQIGLLQAMAEYAGNTVEAARLALRAAEEELSRLISQGAGQEAINNQRAAVIQAKASLRDTDLQDRLGDIDFLMQIGDITTAQAIEMLEAVAQIPDLTEDQVRNIRLKIKSLQQELSRDFQFNLPTFLGLPTVYEARRVTQGTGAGIGYQDNRNVNVLININGAQDPNAVAAQVQAGMNQALGGSQFTAGTRRY